MAAYLLVQPPLSNTFTYPVTVNNEMWAVIVLKPMRRTLALRLIGAFDPFTCLQALKKLQALALPAQSAIDPSDPLSLGNVVCILSDKKSMTVRRQRSRRIGQKQSVQDHSILKLGNIECDPAKVIGAASASWAGTANALPNGSSDVETLANALHTIWENRMR